MDPRKFKEWAISRIKFFIQKSEETYDPYEVEAMFHAIKNVSEKAEKNFHEYNSKDEFSFS